MTSRPNGARFVALVAVAALLLLHPVTVAAHAVLVATTPADGATVEGTPDELAATFSEPLEPESSLSIRNAAGERLAVGGVDPDDPTRVVIADVPDLAPGTYEMRWTSASDDGHVERGTWSFTVAVAVESPGTPAPTETAGPSTEPSTAPTASATPGPDATPTPSPVPTDPTGTSGDVILPIVAALAIVLIGAGALLSRRGRPSGRA